MNGEARARKRDELLQKRFAFEMKRKGGWELVHPAPEEERQEEYSTMLKIANEIWDEFTTGKSKKESMADKRAHNSKLGIMGNKQSLGATK